MTIELRLTALPDSVTEASIISWYKKPGEKVSLDEKLADIETDKVILDFPSPVDGVLTKILAQEGSTINTETVLGYIEEGDSAAMDTPETIQNPVSIPKSENQILSSPAVRNLLNQHNLDASLIPASGKQGRLLKGDILSYLESSPSQVTATIEKTIPVVNEKTNKPEISNNTAINYEPHNSHESSINREPRRVPMNRLRAVIAKRMVEAQQNAAILTTFNEVDLTAVKALRSEFGEKFIHKNDTKLGFMSFFVKAVTESLKSFPVINASIEENDILYHDYFDIGIAVGSVRGLVVPILRDADSMSFAQIESTIKNFAEKARNGSIALEDITGGTFTITNGGTFGSLLSTPILNPPQSAILGMHKIMDRPVVINKEIVIRPMMNLALSYDHRIIDGSDAVRFLVSIKDKLENPASMLLAL
jgi:2-oxoglutarate dehydrogenase E2 component (dihydrolipoamide succinyltransferase)